VFEKVAAAQTARPPWLRPWGVSASAVAHAAVVLAVASIPIPPEDPPATVEAATFLVLMQVPRVPDPLSRLLASAAAAPREPVGQPGAEGGEPRPPIAELRLAPPAEAGAAPEIAPVPTTLDAAADLRSLAGVAGTFSRGMSAAALLEGDGAAETGVISAEVLAEPPRMVNREEITRVLVQLYPRQLRAAGVEGDVMLTFIIGLDGRVEMRSVKVLATAHRDLTAPTLRALSMMRFRPARVDGERVRVRANLPVRWVLERGLAQAP
jgi:TonB family protein